MDMERKETKEEQQWRKIAAVLGVALDGIKLSGVNEKIYFRAFRVDGDPSMMSRFVTFITRLQATHHQQPGATMTMAGGQQVEEATAASTAVATNSSAAPVSCSDYQKGKHWEGIQRQLDQLDSSGFKLSTLPVAKCKGISIPVVKGEPSLLLYGLTATDRYNGAAQSLLEQIENGVQWLLLQAVSGAGKTRAILDVFANSTLDRTLLYFDLSSLPQGYIPRKNFGQADVEKLGDHLSSKQHDRNGVTILFKSLIAARRMVVHYLRGKAGALSRCYLPSCRFPTGRKCARRRRRSSRNWPATLSWTTASFASTPLWPLTSRTRHWLKVWACSKVQHQTTQNDRFYVVWVLP